MLRSLLLPLALLVVASRPATAQTTVYDLRGVPLKEASLAIRGEPGGLLPLAVLAVPRTFEEGLWNVDVRLEIEGLALVENNQDPRPRIDVLLYGLDADGSIVASRARAFRLELAEAASTLLSTGVRYAGEIALPPGRHRLRVLVRNATNDVWGLADVPFTLPDAGGPIASPPLFEPENAAWWTVGTDGPSVPARPVLVAGEPLEARVLAPNVRPAVAELRFVREGTEAFRVPAESSELEPGRFSLRAAVPADAAPGTYDVHLTVRGPTGEVFPEPPRLEAMVAPADTRRRDLTWPGLRGRGVETSAGGGGGLETPGPRQEEDRREDREESQALAAEYRRVLGSLADSPLRAVTALIGFETRAIEGRDVVARVEKLRAAELRVAESLADRDPAAVIPLLALHQQLYLAYRDRQLPSLVAHSRLHSELLAERLAERGGDGEAAEAAALALTALGGTLQLANLPQSSRRLFFRALVHDPDLLPARLGLAMSYERFGQLGAALRELDQMVLDHPAFVEGRLRRGLTLSRLGRVSAARPILEELAVGEEGDRWIRSLAAQELARMDLAEGRFGDALDRLDAALERFAPDGSLLALRAHVLDRRGSPGEAHDVLETIVPTSEPEPRWIYDAWPVAAYDRVRDELERRARQEAPRLLELLGDAR